VGHLTCMKVVIYGYEFLVYKRDKMNPAARLKFMCKVNIKKILLR
jgi:hypothetical protein